MPLECGGKNYSCLVKKRKIKKKKGVKADVKYGKDCPVEVAADLASETPGAESDPPGKQLSCKKELPGSERNPAMKQADLDSIKFLVRYWLCLPADEDAI